MALVQSPEICPPQQHFYSQPANGIGVQPASGACAGQPTTSNSISAQQPNQINGGHQQANCYPESGYPQTNDPALSSQTNPSDPNYDYSTTDDQPTYTNLDSVNNLNNLQQPPTVPYQTDYNGNIYSDCNDGNEYNQNSCNNSNDCNSTSHSADYNSNNPANYPVDHNANLLVNFSTNYPVSQSANDSGNHSVNHNVNYRATHNVNYSCGNYANQMPAPSYQTNAAFSPNFTYYDQLVGSQSSPYELNVQTNKLTCQQQGHQQIYHQQTHQQSHQLQTYQQQQPQVYQQPPVLPASHPQSPATCSNGQNISSNQNTLSKPNSPCDPKVQTSVSPETLRRGLPEFIALLNDSDPRILHKVLKLTMATFFETKDRQKMEIATSCLTLIKTLVGLAARHEDGEVLKLVAQIFFRASESAVGLRSIVTCGYLNVGLSKMLSTQNFSLTANSASTVHNLVESSDPARTQVRTNGIPALVRLLLINSEKFLTKVVDTLRLITIGSQSAKDKILECDGPSKLIRIIDAYQYEKVTFVCFSSSSCLLNS